MLLGCLVARVGRNPRARLERHRAALLKLGIEIGQTTVAKYMAKERRPPSQGWRTFISNHAEGIAALDLFVVPTLSFRLLFGLLILRHDRREILWLGVTAHPTAEWIAQQVTEAIGWEKPPKYLLRDRDRVYGDAFMSRIRAMGIRDRPTAARSPWQNGYCERAIGSIRRDCLDHVIVLGERPPYPSAALLCELLQSEPNTPVLKQGCADEATGSHPRQHRSEARPRRPASSLRSYLISDRDIGIYSRHPDLPASAMPGSKPHRIRNGLHVTINNAQPP
jgi:transposase InsO family protein